MSPSTHTAVLAVCCLQHALPTGAIYLECQASTCEVARSRLHLRLLAARGESSNALQGVATVCCVMLSPNSAGTSRDSVEECTLDDWRAPLQGLATKAGRTDRAVVALGKFDALHKGHRCRSCCLLLGVVLVGCTQCSNLLVGWALYQLSRTC